MTPPQPGPRPGELPVLGQHWTAEHREAHLRWCNASSVFWQAAARELARRVPVQGGGELTFIGGADVIQVEYEDRSYAWLGGTEEDDGDGPWAFGQCNFAGGYRYDPDSCGETFTERVTVEVEEPRGLDEVVEALAEVARELDGLPFVNSV